MEEETDKQAPHPEQQTYSAVSVGCGRILYGNSSYDYELRLPIGKSIHILHF